MIRKIALFSLVAGIASFGIRSGEIFGSKGFSPKPFEIALAISVAGTALYLARNKNQLSVFFRQNKKILRE